MRATHRYQEATQPGVDSESLPGNGERVPNGAAKDALVLDRAEKAESLADQQASVLALLAELLAPTDLERAVDAFAGALQQQFAATRVAIGLVQEDGVIALNAISQQATVDVASDEARLLTEVMEECIDYEQLVCFPSSDAGLEVLTAHRALYSRHDRNNLVSVPLFRHAEPVGVLLLERLDAEPFVADTLDLLEHVALVTAPLIAVRCEAELGTFARLRHAMHAFFSQRFGAQRHGARLLLVLSLAALVFVAMVPLPHSVPADAELVPSERRLIAAPFDGFVEQVVVKPGEAVSAGQLLARLDSVELELELTRRDGEIASAESEFRAAMASYDRQATAIARAKLDRERALRALVSQRLDRIELRAPIDGLIVSGDPADAIGTPVTRGEALFEIARADGFEVHLMVHERHIREVQEGQVGSLSLRSRPSEAMPFIVRAIHPVAESADGASRFRVRAALDVPPGITPRPGESGIASLNTDRVSLARRWGQTLLQHLSELWWRLSS